MSNDKKPYDGHYRPKRSFINNFIKLRRLYTTNK